jgi:hypothetical protein
MTKKTIAAFRAGDISMLSFDETIALKEVVEVTVRGETATFTSDKVSWWLLTHGEKFKDFGFKYEIKGVKL